MAIPENKAIVCYCTSGLGNRLRPLSSCAAIAEETGRDLYLYWDTMSENGCLAEYHDLFKGDNIKLITLEEMEQLHDCLIYSEGHPVVADNDPNAHGAERESVTYGRHALKNLGKIYDLLYFNDFSYCYETDNAYNIIIYNRL